VEIPPRDHSFDRGWDPAAEPSATLHQLLLAYQRTGDPQRLGELFVVAGDALRRCAFGVTREASLAEDAVQETFADLLRLRSRYDASRPALPWLFGIVRRKALKLRRTERRPVDAARLRAAVPGPVEPLESSEALRALARLGEPYRSAAVLRWKYGLSPKQVARLRDEAPGTVRSLLSRALARLRRTLRDTAALFGLAGLAGGAYHVAGALASPRNARTVLGQTAVAMPTGAALLAGSSACLALGLVGGFALRGEPAPAAPRETTVLAAPTPQDERPVLVGRAPAVQANSPVGPADAPGRDLAPHPGQVVDAGGPRLGAPDREPAAGAAPEHAAGALAHGEAFRLVFGGDTRPEVASVADLERRFALDARQAAEMTADVERVLRDLEALRQVPDASGRTWEQAQAVGMRMQRGARVLDDSEALAFRDRRVPARDETFDQAERRLLDEGRTAIRSRLASSQWVEFDGLATDPLFGPLPPGARPAAATPGLQMIGTLTFDVGAEPAAEAAR
jgi:RNA polymerase sigma-70 factor (ECF subfamily)